MDQILQDEGRTQQTLDMAHAASQGTPGLGAGLDESQRHALVEIMPSAIFTCDNEGLITYYNQRAAELWGRHPKLRDPADRYCGSFRLFHHDGAHMPHSECPMALAVRNRRSTRNEEIRIMRPDGSTIVASVNIDPLLDADGNSIGAINVFEDVTRRKEAEDALRVSEERLRLATEAGEIGIFDYDLATRQTYFSPLYRAITKVDRATLNLAEWLDIVHPDDRASVEKTAAQAIATGSSYHYEYRIIWPDGTVRWLEVHGMVEKNEAGTPLRLTGAMRDVTERKQTEIRLHTLYRMRRDVNRSVALEQIYEQALIALEKVLGVDRCAILIVDERGEMHFQATHALSTRYQQQVDGHSPWAAGETQPQPVLIGDVAATQELGALQPLILSEGIRAIGFIPLVEQGKLLGKFMLYYNHTHEFVDAEVQWALAMARDVAHAIRRKQREDSLRQLNATLEQRVQARTMELERSNRELDQFVYVASHDLKAPLRGIAQLATWISEDAAAALPAPSQEHLAKLHGRILRMDMLLNDLLAYSRAGRHRYPSENVELASLAHDVVGMLTPPPGFSVDIPDDLPTLRVERIPLESVILNLVGNALKHHDHPHAGHVALHAEVQGDKRHGDRVAFTIRDDGPGIDPRFHERIFEMFQTLQPRDEVEGSGVGLALAKKLVESRGGLITVESNLGEGATFRFTWPIDTDIDTKTLAP